MGVNFNFDNLSTEMALEIFSYLPLKDKGIAGSVNKRWKILLEDSSLWKPYLAILSIPMTVAEKWKSAVFEKVRPFVTATQNLKSLHDLYAHIPLFQLGFTTLEEAHAAAEKFKKEAVYPDIHFRKHQHDGFLLQLIDEHLKDHLINKQEVISIIDDTEYKKMMVIHVADRYLVLGDVEDALSETLRHPGLLKDSQPDDSSGDAFLVRFVNAAGTAGRTDLALQALDIFTDPIIKNGCVRNLAKILADKGDLTLATVKSIYLEALSETAGRGDVENLIYTGELEQAEQMAESLSGDDRSPVLFKLLLHYHQNNNNEEARRIMKKLPPFYRYPELEYWKYPPD